jgi:hypothetical protein
MKNVDGDEVLKPYVMILDSSHRDVASDWQTRAPLRVVVADGKAIEWSREPVKTPGGLDPMLRTVDEIFAYLRPRAFQWALQQAIGDKQWYEDSGLDYAVQFDEELGYPASSAVEKWWSNGDDEAYEARIRCVSIGETGPDACPLEAPPDVVCKTAAGAPGCNSDVVCARAEHPHDLCEGKCDEALCDGTRAVTCKAGLAETAVACDVGTVCVVEEGSAYCIPTCSSREDAACGGYLCDVDSARCEHGCTSECAAGHVCVEGQCRSLESTCSADSCFPSECEVEAGSCRDWCFEDAHCPDGARCLNGVCTAPCASSEDPVCKGHLCGAEGFCEQECVEGACAFGYACLLNPVSNEGHCALPPSACVANAECEPFACGVDGFCKQVCESEDDCALGVECLSGECTPTLPCDRHHAELCFRYACDVQRGRCRSKCETAADCAPDVIFGCIEGTCQ